MSTTPDEPASRASDPRRRLGALGEGLAARHLSRLGFEIVERNYRTRWGELDIVAFDGSALIFCEVKTRRAPGAGRTPLEAVDPPKRAQLRRMAGRWLCERSERPFASELRFDVIGVTLDAAGRLLSLEHLEGAL